MMTFLCKVKGEPPVHVSALNHFDAAKQAVRHLDYTSECRRLQHAKTGIACKVVVQRTDIEETPRTVTVKGDLQPVYITIDTGCP